MKIDVFHELASPAWSDKTPADAIRDVVDLAVAAEAAGCDTIWLPEHHFLAEYSNAAAPDMLLAAIAQATRRIHLGFAIVPLPLHDPLRVAERLATLDALAPGRVRWGVGRGVTVTELSGFGVDPGESRAVFKDRFEALSSILKTGEAERNGAAYTMQPQLSGDLGRGWLAAVSPESFDLAADMGLNVLTGPFKPWPFVKSDLQRYRKLAPWGETSFTLSVYCEEDHKAARARAEQGIVWVYRRLFEVAKPILAKQVAGYEQYRTLGWTVPLLDKLLSIGVLEKLGLAAVGAPDHVGKRLDDLEAGGLDRVSLVVGGGDLSVTEAARALELIGGTRRQTATATREIADAVTA